ncbi:MAG: alpha/beta hydrolase-fold protein [Pseudomonadota bacterium]
MKKALCALLFLLLQACLAFAGPLDKYVGTYRLDDDFKLWMRDDGGRLYMLAGLHPCYLMEKAVRASRCDLPPGRMALHQWVPLTARGNDVFTFDAVDIRFQFKSGEVVMVQKKDAVVFAHPGGTTLHFARKSSALQLPALLKEIKLDAAVLQKFVGTYQLNPDFDVQVKLERGHLTARPTQGPKFVLFPETPTHFFMRLVPMELTFEPGLIRWYMNGTDAVFKRQPDDYVARMPPNSGPKGCRSAAPASLEHGTFLAVDTVKSAVLGQDLPICVYLPPGYAEGSASYPVIYQTDGEYMESTIALLERKKMQAVVIGLGGFEEREINLVQPGAEKYYRFMVDEAMPQLEARYRVDPKRRVLNGHSMGGNFVLVAALLDAPDRPHFANYLSTDGSFLAASYELHMLMDARRARSARLATSIVMAGAGKGNGVDVRMNYERMRGMGFRGLNLSLMDMVGDDHGSVALAAANEAFGRFFPPTAGLLKAPLVIDGKPRALAHAGMGIYFGEVSLDAGRHLLSVATAAQTVDVDKAGTYVVRIDAFRPHAPVLQVAPKVQRIAAQPIYLRGTMNNWGVSDQLRQGEDERFSVTVQLKAGEVQFKVGSEDFQTVDFGAQAGSGCEKPLVAGGGNVSLQVASDGSYTFTLDAARPDAPVLSVRRNP